MATSQQQQALRQYRRDNGLCIYCGNTPRPDLKTCQACADKSAENQKRATERKAKRGICCTHGCSNKPKPGKTYCVACVTKGVVQTAARRKARVAKGLCCQCGTKPCWNGNTRCQECHTAMRAGITRLNNRRNEAGFCSSCGDHVMETGYKHCRPCIDRRRGTQTGLKSKVLDGYGGPVCNGCGETEVAVLQMDHINGDGREHSAKIGKDGDIKSGRSRMYRWLIANNFPPGFRVLCSNCNIRAARGIPFPNESSSQS